MTDFDLRLFTKEQVEEIMELGTGGAGENPWQKVNALRLEREWPSPNIGGQSEIFKVDIPDDEILEKAKPIFNKVKVLE